VCGTWPLHTERTEGLKGSVNALASSIGLAGALRDPRAPIASRREFLAHWRAKLPQALLTLQQENIAPVDPAQAAIGPGMAVFSGYKKVVESDGSPMRVRVALAVVNQVLDETLSQQEGDYDAWSRWAVKWFDQYGVESGAYGTAETLATAMGVAVK